MDKCKHYLEFMHAVEIRIDVLGEILIAGPTILEAACMTDSAVEVCPREARIALCFAALKAESPDFPGTWAFVLAIPLVCQLSCRSLSVFSVDRRRPSSSGS